MVSQRVNPYLEVVTNDGYAPAPRMSAGWSAICALLSDGLTHTPEECAAVAGDLTMRTVQRLLYYGQRAGRTTTVYVPVKVRLAPGQYRIRQRISGYRAGAEAT